MSGRNTPGSSQQSGSSKPASTPSTSSSSLMAKFYQPMNASFVPPTPTPPPLPPQQQQQQQQQAPIPVMESINNHQGYMPIQTLGIGASAAQLLANLATTPGYISNEAIMEYSRQQQQQHTSEWQQPFSQSGPPANQPQPQPYFAPTQYQQFQAQRYSQDLARAQPSIQQTQDSRISNDPNAAIGALMNELQQTGVISSSPASIASSTPLMYHPYASIPTPQLQPPTPTPQPGTPPQSQSLQSGSGHQSPSASSSTHQPSREQAVDDFGSGKITPQLLKKLAALAESDGQSGSFLLNEINRLRSRQTKTERSLFEDREELLNKHKRDLVKLQASEIMGVNVENEIQRTKSAHREELKRFDQRVVRAMDKEIMLVQESLAQAGVPLMSSTHDPGKIASQIRVLRLLEDMLQT